MAAEIGPHTKYYRLHADANDARLLLSVGQVDDRNNRLPEEGENHDQKQDAHLRAAAVTAVTERRSAERRGTFRWFIDVSLRWNDIDVFGHVNNARYYEFFDTAVLRFLHERDLGLGTGKLAMVVAESGCRFHREIVFTDRLEMGLRVERLGTSSVSYRLGVFINGAEEAVADGHFVHVFVDPATRRPAPFPILVRKHLETILSLTV